MGLCGGRSHGSMGVLAVLTGCVPPYAQISQMGKKVTGQTRAYMFYCALTLPLGFTQHLYTQHQQGGERVRELRHHHEDKLPV